MPPTVEDVAAKDPDAIAKNLNMMGGLVFSQAITLTAEHRLTNELERKSLEQRGGKVCRLWIR